MFARINQRYGSPWLRNRHYVKGKSNLPPGVEYKGIDMYYKGMYIPKEYESMILNGEGKDTPRQAMRKEMKLKKHEKYHSGLVDSRKKFKEDEESGLTIRQLRVGKQLHKALQEVCMEELGSHPLLVSYDFTVRESEVSRSLRRYIIYYEYDAEQDGTILQDKLTQLTPLIRYQTVRRCKLKMAPNFYFIPYAYDETRQLNDLFQEDPMIS